MEDSYAEFPIKGMCACITHLQRGAPCAQVVEVVVNRLRWGASLLRKVQLYDVQKQPQNHSKLIWHRFYFYSSIEFGFVYARFDRQLSLKNRYILTIALFLKKNLLPQGIYFFLGATTSQ